LALFSTYIHVPATHDVPVLNAAVTVAFDDVTLALMKHKMLAGYVGLLAKEYRSTSDVSDDMKTTLDGLTIGARNINYLTSGR
jgi:hypothetical protein